MPALNTGSSRLSALERIYAALSPCVFGPSLAAAYFGGASTDELRARVGRLPAAAGKAVWLHGASAGEMAAAARLVTALREHGYRLPAVFTAANRAGVAYICRWGAPDTIAALAPWDVPAWISRAFDLWQPAALFLIETELWPRLVFEAHRRGVPVLSLSGRIYPRDMARYRAIRGFIAPTLRRLSRILAQNETERDRFIALGAAANRCVAAGNLKYLRERGAAEPAQLRNQLGISIAQRLIVFGSVHHREIPLIFEAVAALRDQDVGFVIAPRHLSSVPGIVREAAALDLGSARRSLLQSGQNWRILILDTIGELRDFYAISAVAVICGGFGKFGGHNLVEALEAGAPVLFGAHFDHFEHEARSLVALTPQAMVSGPEQLAARLRCWLGDDTLRQHIASRQRLAIPDAAAVTRRYLDELSPYLAGADA
ncbi:MAG TPA: glycosyltransferase N-terminal domain-containing protein [Candidatus Binataceae bacterium]|jgi:3-deoxy-D-manno-octulosonic-acid transferase|nr:glycosyltransferase N-terminal domain-containing protein [Candidatus Binataceae bacterium]